MHYEARRTISRNASDVWKVFGNPLTYSKFTSSIGKIEKTENGRRCYNANLSRNWTETIVEGDMEYIAIVDPHSMQDDRGNPRRYPLKTMRGTWKVVPLGENACEILLRFDFEMKYGLLGKLIFHVFRMKRLFEKAGKEILDNYAKELS